MPSRPTVQWNFFAVWCCLGFALSAIVHALSYFGIAAQEIVPAVWALHVGIFPPFFVAVWRLRHWRTRQGRWSYRTQWSALRPYVPRWAYPIGIVLAVYKFVNFFLATSHLPQRGRPVSPVSVSAHDIAIYTIRAFSGHWLIFYFLPALFFLYIPASADPTT
jgi:hypothetical protein